jgi:hypothetical protein
VTVTATSIVKHFDVIKDTRTRQFSGYVYSFLEYFLFQTAEKRLRNSIIPTIGSTTLARIQVVSFTKSYPIIAAILRALI